MCWEMKMRNSDIVMTLKSSFRVKDLADAGGVTPDAVRYYTREGLLKPERDGYNQYKLYSHTDRIRLQFIVRAKTLGYSVRGIKKILNASEKGESPCPMVRDIIAEKITKNKQLLEESLALQQRMDQGRACLTVSLLAIQSVAL